VSRATTSADAEHSKKRWDVAALRRPLVTCPVMHDSVTAQSVVSALLSRPSTTYTSRTTTSMVSVACTPGACSVRASFALARTSVRLGAACDRLRMGRSVIKSACAPRFTHQFLAVAASPLTWIARVGMVASSVRRALRRKKGPAALARSTRIGDAEAYAPVHCGTVLGLAPRCPPASSPSEGISGRPRTTMRRRLSSPLRLRAGSALLPCRQRP
jgi:hypothetical protein